MDSTTIMIPCMRLVYNVNDYREHALVKSTPLLACPAEGAR